MKANLPQFQRVKHQILLQVKHWYSQLQYYEELQKMHRHCQVTAVRVKRPSWDEKVNLFTLRCTLLHWLTYLSLATNAPSRDLVHGAQTIICHVGGKTCLCGVHTSNYPPGRSIKNVHSVVRYMRVHVNDIWFLVHCIVRRVPLQSGGWWILRAEWHILRTW